MNGKIYVGKHSTSDINDGYMGSGTYLNRAIKKHGIENFRKQILCFFETEEEALAFEKEIVNEEFLSRDDVYNLNEGGRGSFYAANKNYPKEARQKNGSIGGKKVWEYHRDDIIQMISETTRANWKAGKYDHTPLANGTIWIGRLHKPTTLEKMRETHQKNQHQQGEKNSQFGKVWIHNLELSSSIRIPTTELDSWVDRGWIRGRKMFKKVLNQMGERNSRYGKVWILNHEKKITMMVPKEELDSWLAKGWIKGRKFEYDGLKSLSPAE